MILHFYLYSAARVATGCRVQVSDFRYDDEDKGTVRLIHKGKKRRTLPSHQAAKAIKESISTGPSSPAGRYSGPRERRFARTLNTSFSPQGRRL